ncbi:MAG TPA: DUF6438 domain-containing protein [Saprospiraceae bacterium]|nr:hypothetical protein [Saprospiraceae bacterium]HRO07802.1 DUF6438 domain-containing protein [Saprospiraceae bacterium]HRP40972.1 DUF6438 domain-containing protein [Saprospiraceae bacterium]
MNKFMLFALVLVMSGCSTLSKVSKLKDQDIVVSLDKSPCATKCSVYNIKVYNNGYVVYEGLTNVEKYGLYAKKISQADLNQIKSDYDKNDFMGFDDQYPNPDPDMPTIVMVYNKDMKVKKITGGLNRPQKLLDLQRMLEMLIRSEGFKQLKAYEAKTTSIQTDKDENAEKTPVTYILDSEIIIELNPNVFMAQWLQKYSQYQIQLMRRVGENTPLWVITYNKTTIDPKDFLEKIKQDPQVKSAEFNKSTTPR